MSAQTSSTTGAEELPQAFNVRYLGCGEAKGLWGIKHTRKPVDLMVASVKESQTNLHVIKLIISKEGCILESVCDAKIETRYFPIETISYGVQDLVYTRVFAIIVVKEMRETSDDYLLQSPYECHAFVCDSRQSARKLTYTLATAFQEYSRTLKKSNTIQKSTLGDKEQRFAIDLRTPEEIESDLKLQDSSEA